MLLFVLIDEKIASFAQILAVALFLQVLIHVVPRLVAANAVLVFARDPSTNVALLLLVLVAIKVRLTRVAGCLVMQVMMMMVWLLLLLLVLLLLVV
uniref:Uncharacterized protein n=1 Tax=Anopheles braziliensis TaxID=58242 RepID=A0A2M3ZLP7_9DIPT